MLMEITSKPIFGITITLVTYLFGVWINKKTKSVFANPLAISSVIIISLLLIFKIPLENYQKGSVFIEMLIAPATTALALSMYKNTQTIRKNFSAIIIGCFVGALTSIICVTVLCRLFNIQENLYLSLLPKSVTTAIGVGFAEELGGITALTAITIIITGVVGNMLAEWVCRKFKITDPVAVVTSI